MTDIFWSTDPATQQAISIVIGLAAFAAATVYLPLGLRAARLLLLERRLRRLVGDAPDDTVRQELHTSLLESLIEPAYREFERRWATARVGSTLVRAPVRLMDVLDEQPLLPFGMRRSLLPVLPGLFLAAGVFAALAGLIQSLGAFGGEEVLAADARSAWMAGQLGLALRAAIWGFACAAVAGLTGRLIEGAFEARSFGLDQIVETAYGSISPGELAEISRQTQQSGLDTLGRTLADFASELNDRLDRGLQRIEQSTARAANLVSQEQRGALHTVVRELSLSVRQGTDHHLSELRNALQRATEHQASVTNGLAETFQLMVENAHTQERVTRTLVDSATAVDQAASSMRASTSEMKPILEHLGATSRSLSETAGHVDETQQVIARTAEGVRSALEHAASGVEDQRQFLELSLSEIRRALGGLGDGLGESLQRALGEVDGALNTTVGQLRETLSESNETIDRLAVPIRAAEGATRETHVALDRVRSEVEALGQWMSQAVKPLRTSLEDVEARTGEIARAMVEFTGHTRQIDKTMEALRLEIHEESRRLQASGSELGRRLKLASDAVGMLETTTSEAARRARPVNASPATHRERHWAPSPLDPDRERGADVLSSPTSAAPTAPTPTPTGRARSTPSMSSSMSSQSSPPFTGSPGLDPDTVAECEDRQVRAASSEADSEHSETSAPFAPGRDGAATGYRVGAPRARGPDPYARFERSGESPSNLRHFPTPDRELGSDLKLSGLLGPSGREGTETSGESDAATDESSTRASDRGDHDDASPERD